MVKAVGRGGGKMLLQALFPEAGVSRKCSLEEEHPECPGLHTLKCLWATGRALAKEVLPPSQGSTQPDGKAAERQDEPSDSGAVVYDPSTQPCNPQTGQAQCSEEGGAVLEVPER